MNQAKQVAARSWRSTLSSEGEVREKEGDKAPTDSEPEDKEKPKEVRKPTQQQDGDRNGEEPDIQSVQLQALDARCARVEPVSLVGCVLNFPWF